VVAAREGLERDQVGVVAEEDADASGCLDVGLGGAAGEAFPAQARAVEPVHDFDPAEGATAVEDLGEGGGAAAGCGEVRPGGHRAANAAAVAEVHRHQR
jgi:hypothetical protein